ncbi:MAG: phosphoribosylaminoimidazolesuccinocarboxamide synthase [Bacillota bacterium]
MNVEIPEGKTKRIEPYDHPFEPRRCRPRNKDDTTAGDGARHDVIAGKAAISTRTTVNIFRLLKACGFPIAFDGEETDRSGDETSFIAYELDMIMLEVVTRGLAYGSYLERNPHAKKGDPFETPLVEFFLKTKGRLWPVPKGVISLRCDDPLMEIVNDGVYLHHAHETFVRGGHFTRLTLDEAFPVPGTRELLPVMASINAAIYHTLRYAFLLVGGAEGLDITFPDMKIEYGFDSLRRLWVGDVIDAESCRLLVNGEHASKQGFREGAPPELAKLQLARAADITDRFPQVTPRVQEWVNQHFAFVASEHIPILC